jgi:hypothetical protein
MKPMLSFKLGAVSAAQTWDERMKGTLATEADLMKERREIRIKFFSIRGTAEFSRICPAGARRKSRAEWKRFARRRKCRARTTYEARLAPARPPARASAARHSCNSDYPLRAEQGVAAEEALKQDMEAKSEEFVEKGAEVYARV